MFRNAGEKLLGVTHRVLCATHVHQLLQLHPSTGGLHRRRGAGSAVCRLPLLLSQTLLPGQYA